MGIAGRMKSRGRIFLIVFLVLWMHGCGKDAGEVGRNPQTGNGDAKTGPEIADGGGEPENTGLEETVHLGENVNGTGEAWDSIEGLITGQSFETNLDGWGEVFFASIAPMDGGCEPTFALVKDGNIVYTFPKTQKSTGYVFNGVSAVTFRDYNQDGKQDVIALVSYRDGSRQWNAPSVFLQENSDNMFYLDHPDLVSYRVEAKTEKGPSFYRDTFLEEYVSAQGLTDSVADLAESWTDYAAYADSLLGLFSVEQQIEVFAKNRTVWAGDIEYADERYCFTLAELTNDGRPVLIVSNQGGTGIYTYSSFYKINKSGELQKLETSFREGDSQPDIIEDSMTVYSSFSKEGIKNHFIVHDLVKDSPDTYLYRVSSLNITDDFVLETPLASQWVVYGVEGDLASTTGEDCNGNALTPEEYDNFADRYYGDMGLTKKTALFKWMDVKSLAGMSDKAAVELLRQAYEGFSMSE